MKYMYVLKGFFGAGKWLSSLSEESDKIIWR